MAQTTVALNTDAPSQRERPLASSLAERKFGANNFDLLRILAATQVLVFHTFYILHIKEPSWVFPLHYFPGVPIFFVISGYLISASYERNNNLAGYLRNRFLRIYPGLWVCLVFTVITAIAFGFNFLHISAVGWFVAQMTGLIYTPKFLAAFGFGSYNGSLWTIPIELQFYCVLPIVYLLTGRHQSRNIALFVLLAVFVGITSLARYFLPNMGLPTAPLAVKLFHYTFIPHFFMFLAGALLQRLGAYRSSLVFGKGFIYAAVYLVFCLLVPKTVVSSMVGDLILALCTVSLAYTLPGAANKILHGNDISYGVYIYHGLILNIMVSMHLLYKSEYLFVVWFSAYAMGYLSWILVERQFLRKKIRKLRAR